MPLSETRTHRVVDIHAHLVPRSLIDQTQVAEMSNVRVMEKEVGQHSFAIAGKHTRVLRPGLVDVDERTKWMDARGIDVQVVSTWADIFGYDLDEGEGVEWTQMLNETLIESARDSDRLEAFASLPMQAPDVAGSLLPQILADGFLGVTFAARIGNKELDDPSFDPVWAALSEHKFAAFIHPGFADDDLRTGDYGMVNAVGRPVDTTIAAARLLGANVPQRYPGAKIILAHGGGAIAFILGRLRRNRDIDPSVGDPETGMRRLHFDSVVFDPDALCYLATKASEGSVLLGSDYPFPIGDPSPVDVLTSSTCLTELQRRSITGGAAARLLGVENIR